MMSFLKDFWAFLSTRKKVLAVADPPDDAGAWGASGVRARKRDRPIYLHAFLTTADGCEF